MSKFSFEKLDVWQKAKEFTLDNYRITAAFAKAEKFGLVSQLRSGIEHITAMLNRLHKPTKS